MTRDSGIDGSGSDFVAFEIAIGIEIGHALSIPIPIAIWMFPIGPHRPSAVHMGTFRLRKPAWDLMMITGGDHLVQAFTWARPFAGPWMETNQ